MKYQVTQPDFHLSPYTGLTKKHWLDICQFLLDGIFTHVDSFNSPIILQRSEYDISYPRPNGPLWRTAAERFEGLARSFLIAAPFLHNCPDTKVNDWSLRDYYKNLILTSVTPGHPNYLMSLEEIRKSDDYHDPAYQHTCECASLVIGLNMCKEVIWDTFTPNQKQLVVDYISQFGHSRTSHHNWRLFNMLILAFLHQHGYPANKDIMRDHASCILSYYAGDGWYRDGHLFDYYCPWAFHVYGPLWNEWYGYEEEPYIAKKIEEYSNKLIETYPAFFDKNSHVTMWGRSSIYRSAASAPLAANFLLKNPTADPGLSRRILSGSLLQFITKEECFVNQVPSLGFYGTFPALIQSYSCAASPFWIANSFLCLTLEDNHPFWSEQENNGIWETSDNQTVSATVLNGPGIVLYNHLETGSTEFSAGKVLMQQDNPNLQGYARLSFHSMFPWEAWSKKHPAQAMQYSLCFPETGKTYFPNILLYGGVRNGVLYRKEYFRFTSTFQDQCCIDLAEIPLSNGILRVDRLRIHDRPYNLYLGHYGISHKENDCLIEQHSFENSSVITAVSSEKALAMVSYTGADCLEFTTHENLNPESRHSTLLYLKQQRSEYYTYQEYYVITALLHKNEGISFSNDELSPIKEISFSDFENMGGYGPVTIVLKDDSKFVVDFEGLEGQLMV